MSQITKEPNNKPLHHSNNPRPVRSLKAVYTIIQMEGVEKSRWVRIGTAYVNRDQSLSVYLDALPVNHKLHIRELPEPTHRS